MTTALLKTRKQKDEEALIRRLAPLIQNEAHLNQILDSIQGGPAMRAAVRALYVPHLTFTLPEDES